MCRWYSKFRCGGRHVHNGYLIAYDGIVLLLFFIAFYLEYPVSQELYYCREINELAKSLLGDADKGYLMDAFALIWGMTITLVIFFLEAREACYYGVMLKNIVSLSFSNIWLFTTGLLYIIFCPLVYLTEAGGHYVIAFCGISCTFATFVAVPIYILIVTRKRRVRKLLVQSTLRNIKFLVNFGESAYIQMKIEILPLTAMIEHLDYENSAEVNYLIDTLVRLFEDYDLQEILKRSAYTHAVIPTWMNRMIDKADIHAKWGADCFGYIQVTFLSRLNTLMENKFLKRGKVKKSNYTKYMTAYAVEMLIPLIRDGSENARRIFRMVWDDLAVLQLHILVYLLLYTEFYHRECSGVLKEDFRSILDDIEIDYEWFRKECCFWKKDLALELWRSWTVFRDDGRNMILTIFLDFCRDIECIAMDSGEGVRTFAVRRIVIKTGGKR